MATSEIGKSPEICTSNAHKASGCITPIPDRIENTQVEGLFQITETGECHAFVSRAKVVSF